MLATFNGEAYLQAQLDSLITQTEPDWTLLVRDDGSEDDTLRIIRDYSRKDDRIQLLINKNRGSGCVLANFSVLLEEAYARGAGYVFCCDQDDVWNSDKLKLTLTSLQQIEGRQKVPSLVHHDLQVVNSKLDLIADSFFTMMQLWPSDQHEPQRLITRNEVTGCAMACNRALLEIALPISDQAVMHDWWLALCAAYFGRMAVLPEKLVQYRQHDENLIGARSFWSGLIPLTNWATVWRRGNEELVSTINQAEAFLLAVSHRLDNDPKAMATLNQYTGILLANRFKRLQLLRQLGLWRSHWLLNIVLVIRVLLLPRPRI